MKVTVLGAGNGGQTLAGDLAHRGAEVVLYEHPDFRAAVDAIVAAGNRIEISGATTAVGRLSAATTDIEEATVHGDVVYFLAPSFAQQPILEAALPHFRSGQTVILLPGNFGSLWLRHRLRATGRDDIVIGETETIPYACRLLGPGRSSVWGIKTSMGVGTLPGSRCEETIRRIAEVFPVPLWPYPNVLKVGLANTNMVIHCVTMLMNGGRIESDPGGFRFYVDGMTESVCRVMEAMDRERIEVGRACGFELVPTGEDIRQCYGLSGEGSLHEILTTCDVYSRHGVDSPRTMKHRYLTEDVPYLLVPVAEIGRLVGVPTPVIDSVVTMAEATAGAAYRADGRSLASLGLDGMSKDDILAYVA